MSNFLSTWSLAPADRARLDDDPGFCRGAFERLLGEPARDAASPRGWVSYGCPAPDCGRPGKFGVCYAPDSFGGYLCFVCGLRGKGFTTLCRALGVDPGAYVDAVGPAAGNAPCTERARSGPAPAPEAAPLSPEDFGRIWRWVQGQATLAYGEGALRPAHAAALRGKGLTRTPQWFTLPEEDQAPRALARWGRELCARAGLWDPARERLTGFARPGRLALAYPPAPWAGQPVEFGHLRTYDPLAQTAWEKKFKVLGPRGYGTADRPYVRADPSRAAPWVVCEGEVKPEASAQAGVPALGLPGMAAGHAAVADLVCRALTLSGGRSPTALLVCLDTEADAAQQSRTDAVAGRLHDTLRHALAGHPFRLPLGRIRLRADPGEKCDVDSWLAAWADRETLEAARARWREAVARAAARARP